MVRIFSLAEVRAAGKTLEHVRKKHKFKVSAQKKNKSKENIELLKNAAADRPT